MSCEMSITTIDATKWNALVECAPDISLQQLFEYGVAKEKTGRITVVRHLFHQAGQIVGAAQATIRHFPFSQKGLVWISRGPLIIDQSLDQNILLHDMLTELKKYWVIERKMYLRLLPATNLTSEGKLIFDQMEYRVSPKLGWASIRVNLHKSEEELYLSMHKLWRRYFRVLNEDKVICTVSNADNEIKTLLRDYQQLVKKKGFDIDAVSVDFLLQLQEALPEKNKLLVFNADCKGQCLGRLLIARYGHTAMAYIIGQNIAGQGRHVNHYLYWEAIKKMKAMGYSWFDLGGAHPQNTPSGIMQFKLGFGGEAYQLANEIEVCTSGLLYGLLRKIISSKR